ncbi:MAG: hypothetical protein ACLPUO_00645 [Streptosporangiaceae bacterium]
MRTIVVPAAWKTASNEAVKFDPRSRSQELDVAEPLAEGEGQVTGLPHRQTGHLLEPAFLQLDFRCLRSAGPKDRGSGRAREIDSTQGINGCAQGLTGVHQVIYQADRGSRRESLACEAAIAHPQHGQRRALWDTYRMPDPSLGADESQAK